MTKKQTRENIKKGRKSRKMDKDFSLWKYNLKRINSYKKERR